VTDGGRTRAAEGINC